MIFQAPVPDADLTDAPHSGYDGEVKSDPQLGPSYAFTTSSAGFVAHTQGVKEVGFSK